jgi:cytochrome c-type protein NapC
MKKIFQWVSLFVSSVIFCLFTPSFVGADEPDWSQIDEDYIDLFYPGQTSWEWLISQSHEGYKQVKKGRERCLDCHVGEEEGRGKAALTKKLDDDPPPEGTSPMITLKYKAAYDSEYLYLWFQWPAPAKVEEGKITAINIMIDEAREGSKIKSRVKYFNAHGCWITCHNDGKSMPYAPTVEKVEANPYYKSIGAKEITKYLPNTRTILDSTGGWRNIKTSEELDKEIASGRFVDLWRFIIDSSHPEGKVVDGYIFASRFDDKGQNNLSAKGEYKDGNWTVVFKKKLNAGDPAEDKIIKPGKKKYSVGISIHINSIGRRHYTAFSRYLGFDDPMADINAVKVK